MVNLIAGEKVVPELVQDDFTAENVMAELRKIVPDGPDRFSMLEGLASVKSRLRGNKATPAAETAAAIVSSLLRISRSGVRAQSAEVNLSG
jgi:lipid-A-disaccharide synthase